MKTRIRKRQFPGDVSRQEKIALWDGKSTRVSPSAAKSWKRTLLAKERAVLKRLERREVEREGVK